MNSGAGRPSTNQDNVRAATPSPTMARKTTAARVPARNLGSIGEAEQPRAKFDAFQKAILAEHGGRRRGRPRRGIDTEDGGELPASGKDSDGPDRDQHGRIAELENGRGHGHSALHLGNRRM